MHPCTSDVHHPIRTSFVSRFSITSHACFAECFSSREHNSVSMSCHVRTTLTSGEVLIGFLPLKRDIWTFHKTSRHCCWRLELHHLASRPIPILRKHSQRNSLPRFQFAANRTLHPRFLRNSKGKDSSYATPNIYFRSQIASQAPATHQATNHSCPEFQPEIDLHHRASEEATVHVTPSDLSRTRTVVDGIDVLAKSSQKSTLCVQSRLSGTSRKLESGVTSTNDSVSREYAPLPWQVQKQALAQKFGSSGWAPRKRLSPDALEGIRSLNSQFPEKFPTPVLANHFQVSPEAIRRILKSKWRPKEDEEVERRERWNKRGESIWRQMVEIGIKPPKKWRDMGLRKRRTHATGMSADDEVSVREYLKGALRCRPISKDSAAIHSWKRQFFPPAPLSERIL